MTRELQQRHPLLMVPNVITLGVVIYTNGEPYRLDAEALRQALVAQLPPGTGVGSIQFTHHGVYEGQQGASA